ncbi:IclR family transcriptional regulator [Arthrobacter sp. CAU 1506]|uniref:IclR family transcriptional regulator n=1 Tax=Arthrobacter sp. CAU 1506 TaxID=2560052 RepID=UPI0010ABDD84|nr:IclR family transcriptional regulator [Arthrobacter sp. CAU 1506]TJY67529.1 IclR family transcriptional regulator [Arthrobacter sp. CAU 1506]
MTDIPDTSSRKTPDGTPDARGASVILNAIQVMRCFSVETPLLGVTEIATRVGLHKSTVSRILATLEQEDLVERDSSTRRFKLGLGLIAVTGPLLADLDVRRAAYPVLQELTERTGETTALMVWNGNQSVCVEQIASPQQVKHTTPLGTRYNTALSSSVQIFLAEAGVEAARGMIADGTVILPDTAPAALDAYATRLREVSAHGLAVNYGETSAEEVGVAAPVFDHRGDLAACVMLAAPRFRISEESLSTLSKACKRAAAEVTVRLGGHVEV